MANKDSNGQARLLSFSPYHRRRIALLWERRKFFRLKRVEYDVSPPALPADLPNFFGIQMLHVLSVTKVGRDVLKDGEGYVWVLANYSATICIFRPSREGGFLRQMLRDFKGVLVSDFFSAYDGLPCLQQRCLIHLMRDLNRAILDNPFDEEVQSITAPFGVLEVNCHDHRPARSQTASSADAYKSRRWISSCDWGEDLRIGDIQGLTAKTPAKRERLFTFLRHDGVSWINNLAENAIKHVGAYRDNVRRSIKAAGLSEYLVLLSLFQSCRVMGISFLKFFTFAGTRYGRVRDRKASAPASSADRDLSEGLFASFDRFPPEGKDQANQQARRP